MRRQQVQKSFLADSTTPREISGTWLHLVWQACPGLPQLLLFYVTYVLAGGFGQGLALIPGVAISFWPPAGIFAATLLLTSKYSWPWWILVGCLAELTCNAIWFNNPVPFALIYFSANALVALTVAGLISYFIKEPFRLETVEEASAFIVLGAGIAPMVSATLIATTDALLGKHPFWTTWPLVWLGDSTGLLVSAPLTFVALQVWRERASLSWPRTFEVVVLMVILLGISLLAFKNVLPTPYLTLPPLLWMAVRFQLRGAAVALAAIAIMEASFAVTSDVTLAGQADVLREKIVGLQAFLGIAAISSLVVAVLSLQHQQALLSVKDSNAELEKRVEERTTTLQETNTQLTLALTAARMTAWRFDPHSGVVELSANATVALELPVGKAIQNVNQGYALIHPDDVEQHRAKVEQALATNGHYVSRYRHAHEGKIVWLEDHAQAVTNADTQRTEIIGITANINSLMQAEEALLSSERFSRGVLEASPDCVKVMAPDGQIEFMNANGQRQMEIDDFSLCAGNQWNSLWPQESRQIIQDSIVAAKSGVESRFEAFCPTAKGTKKWWDVIVTPVLDGKGRCKHIVSVSRDITERKQVDLDLRESERRLTAVLEALPLGVALIDRDGKAVVANDVFVSFVPGSLPSRDEARSHLWEAYHSDGRRIERVDYPGARALRGERVWPGQDLLYHGDPNRGPVWTRVAAVPLYDGSGEIVGATAVVSDIDEEKRARDSLGESEARFMRASELARFGAYTFDVAARRASWSPGFWNIMGRSDASETSFDLFMRFIHPDDRERVGEALSDILRHIGPFEQEYRITKSDGSAVWVMDRGETIGPLHPETGLARRAAGMILDITDRKRNELQQALLMNELNHRVKNTLATIQSIASQTMRASPNLTEAKSRFEARLMSLSKAHDVLTNEKWESASLADIVDQASMPYRGAKQDRFIVKGDDVRVSAQMALAFAMALHELCTNAVKYGALTQDKGKVTISWSVLQRKKAASILKFRWSETGGPPVTLPNSKGFGTKLIERSLATDLGGNVKLTFAKSGVICAITALLERPGGPASMISITGTSHS